MVAKIKSGKSITGAINYNEHKVKLGKAKLIGAALYGKEPSALCFNDKLFRLKDLAERNYRTKTNTVHLSLNFAITEHLEAGLLLEIADIYMSKIGFGNQPYLIYQHFDAGHPHMHIVTTNIDSDGNRISLHNIGRERSEPARKEIEKQFSLIQADSKAGQNQSASPTASPLIYGDADTKRSVTNIVTEVIKRYKFTSLPEFNAVLKLYNIEADRGPKETIMFDKGGLRYWVLDQYGKRVGVPIKASAIYKKPTLKLLNDRFRLGEYLRKPFKEPVKKRIDLALSKALNKRDFIEQLHKEQIIVVFRENADKRIYGVTFIDQRTEVVFNGSDLGKNYSAAALTTSLHSITTADKQLAVNTESMAFDSKAILDQDITSEPRHSLLDALLNPIDQSGTENLFERKKKKKRKKLNL